MSRDLTLHVIRCTIAGSPTRVYSCNKREAFAFARRTGAHVRTTRLPASWQSHVTTNDRPSPSASHDHAAATRRILPANVAAFIPRTR